MAKRKLYIVILEKIEQRYTKQWYYYLKTAFSKWFDVEYIVGTDRSEEIKAGKFLDINRTNMWKGEQIVEMAKLFDEGKVKKGDRFLFMDAWHYGITALKYMSQLNNIKVKIYGYWHAGTYDPYDFITQAGLKEWASCNEAGWLLACDKHFVATKHHRNLIDSQFDIFNIFRKIDVVGFPMDWKYEIKREIGPVSPIKNDLVVFPHRLDKEKQPQVFDRIGRKLLKDDIEFIKTLEVTKSKKDYYNLISKAKIVFSANLQETYGIGTVEAVMLGAIPIVPNRLTYLEMYPKQFRYNDETEAMMKIKHYIKNYNKPLIQKTLKNLQDKLNDRSKTAVKRMARLMAK